jgi:hypothetical protein
LWVVWLVQWVEMWYLGFRLRGDDVHAEGLCRLVGRLYSAQKCWKLWSRFPSENHMTSWGVVLGLHVGVCGHSFPPCLCLCALLPFYPALDPSSLFHLSRLSWLVLQLSVSQPWSSLFLLWSTPRRCLQVYYLSQLECHFLFLVELVHSPPATTLLPEKLDLSSLSVLWGSL